MGEGLALTKERNKDNKMQEFENFTRAEQKSPKNVCVFIYFSLFFFIFLVGGGNAENRKT